MQCSPSTLDRWEANVPLCSWNSLNLMSLEMHQKSQTYSRWTHRNPNFFCFYQHGLQVFLVVIAVLSVPVLLLGKPLYLYWRHNGNHHLRMYRVRVLLHECVRSPEKWLHIYVFNIDTRTWLVFPVVFRDMSVCGVTVKRRSTCWGVMTWRRAAVTVISLVAECTIQRRWAQRDNWIANN